MEGAAIALIIGICAGVGIAIGVAALFLPPGASRWDRFLARRRKR